MNVAVRAAAALALGVLAACASVPPAGMPLTGEWGGEHVALKIGADSGALDYDCAAGTIDGPLVMRGDGSFEAAGTHTPGTGGPVRIDQIPQSYSARYSGRVNGDRMVLTVDVPARGFQIGPLSLRRGAQPILLRCL